MSLRLAVLSRWTPKYIIGRELDRVSGLTNTALESIFAIHAPEAISELPHRNAPAGAIATRRSEMAQRHAIMVDALQATVGRERAMDLGRAALFEVGRELGREARERLRVGDAPRDLVRAAKILYRVLGIDFHVVRTDDGKAEMVVHRCALSNDYSELTCLVMSATDEGVVRGLNPNASMNFTQRITAGCNECKATIELAGRVGAR